MGATRLDDPGRNRRGRGLGVLQPLFRKDPFRENTSDPLSEITRLINAHGFDNLFEVLWE